jgi:hypothetical protein
VGLVRLCTLPDDSMRVLTRELFLALDVHGRGVLRADHLLPLLTTVHAEEGLPAADLGLPRPPDGARTLLETFDVMGSGSLDFAAFLALVDTFPPLLFPLQRLRDRARAVTLGRLPFPSCMLLMQVLVRVC